MRDQFYEEIVLAGGCFWCMEALFRRLKGVEKVESGYTGGGKENPTYQEVCRGDTGHAEALRITFDPAVISRDEVLRFFWKAHDPTTLNRQGSDVGTQYRSAVFFSSPDQEDAARRSLKELDASGIYDNPAVTEVKPLGPFYPAEGYHRDYYEENRRAGYCRLVIHPKLKKMGLPDKAPEKTVRGDQ